MGSFQTAKMLRKLWARAKTRTQSPFRQVGGCRDLSKSRDFGLLGISQPDNDFPNAPSDVSRLSSAEVRFELIYGQYRNTCLGFKATSVAEQ